MVGKCASCGHEFCSHRDFVADNKANRDEVYNVVLNSGRIVHLCGNTKSRKTRQLYCCKCGTFTTKK